ncbi:hypothetical protein MMC29_007425, partial [Sticta canariensis]|nr:hypothetical protein [Sticta canariensis]
MHVPSTIFLASLLTLFSTTVSAAPSCVVPAIAAETLEKPFTLTALAPKSSWSVLLKTPSRKEETQPFLSHTKIAPPVFRLTKGKLTTVGANGQTFPAHFGPLLPVFPPDLVPIYFGRDYDAETIYYGGYACDSKGETYLQLKSFLPFAVYNVTEGENIFGQPEEFR